jgi:DNA-binding beta-propeller fold protein YncE
MEVPAMERTRRLIRCVAVAGWLLAAACSGPGALGGGGAPGVPGYRLVRDVQLPGDTSRWDYQVYDRESHRLYIAHLGASQVVAFDTRDQRVAGVVSGVDQVHGLVLAPDLGRLYASATGRNQVDVIDISRLAVIATAPAGDYPDGLAYVPDRGKVYVSNEHDSVDTVLEARTNREVGRVPIGGSIGNTQYDPATRLVYVASGSDNRLVVVDPATDSVLGRYALKGCDGAHGVYLDAPERQRVFVACEGNARLVVFDLRSKSVTTAMGVGDGPDVLALDPGLHRLYVASESGTVTVFDVAGTVHKLAEGAAGPNAHSAAVDPQTHILYLPLTDVGGRPVLRELAPVSGP